MFKNKFLVLGLAGLFFMTGCATTRAHRPNPNDLQSQVTALQSELQAKDQQIEALEYELQSRDQSLPKNSFSSGSKTSLVRVSGVSVQDVQKALIKAGFDPGPADGRVGKKTKKAIKAFQKKNSLTPDGVVGEKTWTLLKT